MNFKTWVSDYYTIYKALDLKPTTVKSYLRNLSSIPDAWEYETVSLSDVQKLINDLAAKLSASSVKHIYQIIREPLENGFRFGLADMRGVLTEVRLPKMRKKLVHALSDAEVKALLPHVLQSSYCDVFLTLIGTGMRFCELAGLNNKDFSPSSSVLKIQRRYYRGELAEGSKTDSGIREIPLNFDAKGAVLRNWCPFTPNEPLFHGERNLRLSYNTVIHEWHRICDRAQICRCGLHVLRHTFASQLLDLNVSLKVVSSLLGHKSITVTADIYCDVSMASKKSAVAFLEKAHCDRLRAL